MGEFSEGFNPELLRSPEIAEELSTATSGAMAAILQDIVATRTDLIEDVSDRLNLLDKEELLGRYLSLLVICGEVPGINSAITREVAEAKEILDQLLGDKEDRLEIMELFKRFK